MVGFVAYNHTIPHFITARSSYCEIEISGTRRSDSSCYAAVTLLLMPLSYGVMQIRVSEALTVLPALLLQSRVVCRLSRVQYAGALRCDRYGIGKHGDLLAAIGSYKLRKELFSPAAPVLANGLIIGPMFIMYMQCPFPFGHAFSGWH